MMTVWLAAVAHAAIILIRSKAWAAGADVPFWSDPSPELRSCWRPLCSRLFSCVSAASDARSSVSDLRLQANIFDRVIATNLRGIFLVCGQKRRSRR